MRRFRFKPSFRFTAAIIVLLPILISLGYWQLHRAEEKRLLQTRFELRDKLTAIALAQAKNLPANNFYPIQVEGFFDNNYSFLLDNQIYQHKVGYQVITPLLDKKTQQWILINRGWLPMGANRTIIPHISPIKGKVTLKGYLYTPKKNPFILQEIEQLSWPLRIEHIDLLSISKRLNRSIYPQIILLDPKSPYGFVRDWQPVNMKASIHLGYAVQWFSMAIVLLIIYLAMSIKRV